ACAHPVESCVGRPLSRPGRWTRRTHGCRPRRSERGVEKRTADVRRDVARDCRSGPAERHGVKLLLHLIPSGFDFRLCEHSIGALCSVFDIRLRLQWNGGIALTLIIDAYVNLQYQAVEVSGLIVGAAFSALWLVGVMRFGL